jgi:hypothetical protein
VVVTWSDGITPKDGHADITAADDENGTIPMPVIWNSHP